MSIMMKKVFLFCLLAVISVQAMPSLDDEAEDANEDVSQEEVYARSADEDVVKSRSKRWAVDGDSPKNGLNVDVDVDVEAPSKVLSNANVDVDIGIKASDPNTRHCELNGNFYNIGEVAHENASHCFILRCLKKETGPTLEPEPMSNCICTKNCPEICLTIYDPVCGTDNITYGNACSMQGEVLPCGPKDVEIFHHGECRDACTKELNPVCGSNDITYDNECFLVMAAFNAANPLTIAYKGRCEDTPIKGRYCKYNGKEYQLGGMIQPLVEHCLKITCQLSSDTLEPTVTFQEFPIIYGDSVCSCSRTE